mmetsp:Transcript_40654/g.129701  ORF Transcript_40654/g.129701 Transcript_40654/m.129701 type:complete len:172 (-) Transcript_40654:104-619(-)
METAIVEIETLKSPKHFGEVGGLTKMPHGRSIVAVTNVELMVLPIYDVLKRLPEAQMRELQRCVEKYDREEEQRERSIKELGWGRYKQQLVGERLRMRALGADADGAGSDDIMTPSAGMGRGRMSGGEGVVPAGMNAAQLKMYGGGIGPGAARGRAPRASAASRLRRTTIQ